MEAAEGVTAAEAADTAEGVAGGVVAVAAGAAAAAAAGAAVVEAGAASAAAAAAAVLLPPVAAAAAAPLSSVEPKMSAAAAATAAAIVVVVLPKQSWRRAAVVASRGSASGRGRGACGTRWCPPTEARCRYHRRSAHAPSAPLARALATKGSGSSSRSDDVGRIQQPRQQRGLNTPRQPGASGTAHLLTPAHCLLLTAAARCASSGHSALISLRIQQWCPLLLVPTAVPDSGINSSLLTPSCSSQVFTAQLTARLLTASQCTARPAATVQQQQCPLLLVPTAHGARFRYQPAHSSLQVLTAQLTAHYKVLQVLTTPVLTAHSSSSDGSALPTRAPPAAVPALLPMATAVLFSPLTLTLQSRLSRGPSAPNATRTRRKSDGWSNAARLPPHRDGGLARVRRGHQPSLSLSPLASHHTPQQKHLDTTLEKVGVAQQTTSNHKS